MAKRHIFFPNWFVILTIYLPPIAAIYFLRRGRAGAGMGHCVQCGYDLRATPDRCPECGTIPAAPTRTG